MFGNPDELFTLKTQNSWQAISIILSGTAIFGIPTIVFIVLTQSIVGNGVTLNPKSIKFKFDKLNPITGFRRIFSVKGLVELVKALAKVILLIGVVIAFLWYSLPRIIYLNTGSLDHGIQVLYSIVLLFVLSILIILSVIGIGDYVWSQYSWLKKLRMSRQDLKEEFKETEGSPEVKSRIRRLQMEASRRAMQQAEAIEDVKDATVVITKLDVLDGDGELGCSITRMK